MHHFSFTDTQAKLFRSSWLVTLSVFKHVGLQRGQTVCEPSGAVTEAPWGQPQVWQTEQRLTGMSHISKIEELSIIPSGAWQHRRERRPHQKVWKTQKACVWSCQRPGRSFSLSVRQADLMLDISQSANALSDPKDNVYTFGSNWRLLLFFKSKTFWLNQQRKIHFSVSVTITAWKRTWRVIGDTSVTTVFFFVTGQTGYCWQQSCGISEYFHLSPSTHTLSFKTTMVYISDKYLQI